jgi:hypothetical protein
VTNLAKINPADDCLGGLKEGAMFFSQTVAWDDEQLPSHCHQLASKYYAPLSAFPLCF